MATLAVCQPVCARHTGVACLAIFNYFLTLVYKIVVPRPSHCPQALLRHCCHCLPRSYLLAGGCCATRLVSRCGTEVMPLTCRQFCFFMLVIWPPVLCTSYPPYSGRGVGVANSCSRRIVPEFWLVKYDNLPTTWIVEQLRVPSLIGDQ